MNPLGHRYIKTTNITIYWVFGNSSALTLMFNNTIYLISSEYLQKRCTVQYYSSCL